MAAYSGTPTRVGIGAYEKGERSGKLVSKVKRMSLSLTAQGGLTNTIGAVALGFRSGGIISAKCILFTDGSANKRFIGLFTDGTNLYTADPLVSTDADRGKAADVTGTLICEVEGLS
jgi:hypothetical protein